MLVAISEKRQKPPKLTLRPRSRLLTFWQRLRQQGLAILSAPERGYELDQFIRGEVAMQITGPWTLAQLQQSGVDFGVLPMPALKTTATALGGENLFVFRSTPPREQAALAFFGLCPQ